MRTKILVIIIILATLLRFVGVGANPPSLNWDEIAIGWNAYSILQTGKDEYGKFLPLTFRSFDDYKSPAYIYLTAASIAVWGKNEFAVRFPSALFGTLTVLLCYFFTREMLTRRNTNPTWNNRIANISVMTAFFLAISPWHIHFSRVAFEANLALFWELLGTTLLLRWFHQKKISILLLSVLSFGAALYSYASARLLVVLILIGITLYCKKEIWYAKQKIVLAVILGLLVCIPLFVQMYQGVGFARYNATTILGKRVVEIFARNGKLAKEDFDAGNGWLSSKVHNYRIPLTQAVIANYFSHFNYSFLFVYGDLPRHQVPGFGLLYVWQLPLILLGVVVIIRKKDQINAWLPMWWLLMAPIPAALTWQVPHAIRSLLMLPALSLLSAIGLWTTLKVIQKNDLKAYTRPKAKVLQERISNIFLWLWPKVAFILTAVFLTTSLTRFILSYAVNLPPEFGKYWLYGRKEMVQSVEAQKQKADSVIVSLSLDWAYLWFLWYGDYSPREYLQQGGTVSGGFAETQNKVGKIQFHNFNYEKQKNIPDTLMVGTPQDFPGKLVPNEKINDLSGEPVIYIVKS